MSPADSRPSRLLYIASAVIVILGSAAALLALRADDIDTDPHMGGYQVIGGKVFPIAVEESARAVRYLELIGGKPNLYAAELDAWFASLGHGRRLSCTIETATFVLAALCVWAARLSAEGNDE